jgi:hypothetical protein
MKPEDKLRELAEALEQEGCDREKVGDLEVLVIEQINRIRRQRDNAIRDMQAAELLPLGRMVAAERLGVAPSTVYKMTHRFRRARSTPEQAA